MAPTLAPGLHVAAARVAVAAPSPATQDAPPRHLQLVTPKPEIGRRLVGATTVLAVAMLGVLLGLAIFHNMLARGQFELSEVEADIARERELLVDLRYRLEQQRTPAAVERMAEGALGLRPVANPTDLVIAPTVISAVGGPEELELELDGDPGSWVATKPLLADQ